MKLHSAAIAIYVRDVMRLGAPGMKDNVVVLLDPSSPLIYGDIVDPVERAAWQAKALAMGPSIVIFPRAKMAEQLSLLGEGFEAISAQVRDEDPIPGSVRCVSVLGNSVATTVFTVADKLTTTGVMPEKLGNSWLN